MFTVDFSKHEYTGGKVQVELDHYTIYVYPPAMIGLEKLRAICQQMPEYALLGKTRRARARDFLDIFEIITKAGVDFDDALNKKMIGFILPPSRYPSNFLAKSLCKETSTGPTGLAFKIR